LGIFKSGKFLQNPFIQLYQSDEISAPPEKDWIIDQDDGAQLPYFKI